MTSKHEYTYSSSKNSTDADEIFDQVDTNNDGVIDRDELAAIVGGKHKSSSYETLRHSSGGGIIDSGSVGYGGVSGTYHSTTYEGNNDYDISAISKAASYTAETNAAWSRYGAEVRGVGLYVDPNPEIIRRQIPSGTETYTQHIRIRFLQPPHVASAGPLIIKEVRPPAPAPLPPLRIRQQAPAPPQLPPLILRERPPTPPAQIPSETIIRNLPALPPPPRSVIIERYPAPPPRPRDIIIERWLPYTAGADRKTIVHRAEETKEYTPVRNVIIEYESTGARVHREFQQLGVTREDPQTYISQYRTELLDSRTLLEQARAAGVIEDISIPSGVTSLTYSSDATHRIGGEDIGGYSSYSTSGYTSSSGNRNGGLISGEIDDGYVGRNSGGFRSTTIEKTYTSGGGVSSTGYTSTKAKF
ncbi:unnamed protein product [Adineta steineri]|uniref:EF-hand domain-containing protein n=1 Tax=Adineta steineri TaxID=433720 RepID=A0A814V3T4_9BILA|nr:unnamed protein product [Adineta steineri]CAF1184849.1 unnamed protein product [Adineta steineri]